MKYSKIINPTNYEFYFLCGSLIFDLSHLKLAVTVNTKPNWTQMMIQTLLTFKPCWRIQSFSRNTTKGSLTRTVNVTFSRTI